MKIKRFITSGLHEYFDFDIEFNDDLTFLTGINGSGKTTVLNSIEALLMPRLDFMVLSKFHFIQLTVCLDGENIDIRATNGKGTTTITCSKFPKEKFVIDDDIVREFMIREYDSNSENRSIEHRFQQYAFDRMRKNDILRFISELTTPILLGLDRRIFSTILKSEPNQENRLEISERNMLGVKLEDSLTVALSAAKSKISQCYQRSHDLDLELRKNLMSAFLEENDDSSTVHEVPDLSIKKVKEFNVRLEEASEVIADLNSDRKSEFLPLFIFINKQIATLNKISFRVTDSTIQKKNNEYFNIVSKNINKIEAMLNLVKDYKEKYNVIFKNVKNFLYSVNKYFADSNKLIDYDEQGNLYCMFSNITDSEHVGCPLYIDTLSSGEKQLAIIFAHLYFCTDAKNISVLMIDEPELSLHVLWQENFISEISKTSTNTQFIIATHAPTVIMNRLDHCIEISQDTEQNS